MAKKNNKKNSNNKQKGGKGGAARSNVRTVKNAAPMQAGRVVDYGALIPRPQPSHVSMARAMCDPFSIDAHGCKYPDGYSSNTLPMQLRGTKAYTASAAGTCICATASGLPSVLVDTSTITGAKYDFSAQTYSQVANATFVSYMATDAYRLNCAGIVIRCLQNAMVAQGKLIVTKVNKPVATLAGQWIPGQVIGADVKSLPIMAGKEYVVLFSPCGEFARSFQPQAQYTVPAWDSIIIDIQGASTSGSCIEVEYVFNVELAPSATDSANLQFATKNPPPNPFLTTVINTVGTVGSNILEMGVEAAGRVIAGRVGSVMAALGGGGGRRIPLLGN